MKNGCVEVSIYGEKNYKLLLEVIRREIEKERYIAITPVQALMLINIGDSVVTIGEIISRGYYLGTNSTYNLRKLINAGYLESSPSDYDRRAIHIKLTDQGFKLVDRLGETLNSYMRKFKEKTKKELNFTQDIKFLRNMESFWNDVLLLRV